MTKMIYVLEGMLSNPNTGMPVKDAFFNFVTDDFGSTSFPGWHMLKVDGTGIIINGKNLTRPNSPTYQLYVRAQNHVMIKEITNEQLEEHLTKLKPTNSENVTTISDNQLTDEEIKTRISDRFDTFVDIVVRMVAGTINGVIVSGAPGVGKSYCAMDTLTELNAEFEKVSGKSTPGGLYELLYSCSGDGTGNPPKTLIVDDCDSILTDDLSLNLLKSALDTTKTRRVSWASMKEIGVPNSFTFNGNVIFITNADLEAEVKKDHKTSKDLAALLDRSLYLDLTIKTVREKLIRIRQVAYDYGMLAAEGLSPEQAADVMDYIETFKDDFRILSIRRLTLLAGLCKTGGNWRRIANVTTLAGSRNR